MGHVNVQSCLLIIFQYQPISLQHYSLSVEKPIGFWLTDFLDASMGIPDTDEDNSNVKMTTCYSVVFISDDTSVFIRTVFVGPARID